jgi:phage terminase large subunit-like protein
MEQPLLDLETVEAQAKALAEQMIAERAKVDLFYLASEILGGKGVLDVKVHGPLCRALRPLLFYKEPEAIKGVEFPSDYGRTEEQGMPTDEEKLEFLAWQAQFMPASDTAAHEDKFNDAINQLLALMPRGTLKSTVITIGFAIQWHLNFPEDRVLIDSEVFSKSKGFLAEITGHYESNKKLRRIYGTLYKDENGLPIVPDRNRKFDTWSTEAINLSCRSRKRKEPSIDCAGIDVTKNGFHYDLILGDDLHSEKNTKTPEQIENVKNHYKLLFSLLEPGGSIAIIGTRWDDDDLYQMIIDEEADEYNFITRSAESEDGELFYPGRLTRKVLDKLRKKQGGYMYSCQYLNNPVDQENATFKKSMFKHLSIDDFNGIPTNLYGLVDPSYKGKQNKGDYAAFVLGAMGTRKELYCRYAFKDKLKYSQIFDKMAELDDMFQPRYWQVEAIGTKSLEDDFDRMNDERVLAGKRRLNIRYIRSRPNTKEERIAALSPYYERGDAYHVVGGGMIDALEGELTRYPKAKKDDLSDCWSDMLTVGATPPRRSLDDSEVQKRNRYRKMLKKPRSPVTGY